MDILKRANQTYRDEHNNTSFNNDEVWNVLRKHRNWDAPAPIDLTGDIPSQINEALFGHDEEPHPMGKKRAEGTSTGGSSFSSIPFGEFMQQEFRLKG